MEPEIRYCTTADGISIAYSVEGDGPPLLVGPVFFESFTHDEVFPNAAEMYKRLGWGRTLVRYCPRGTGQSQRDVPKTTVDGWVLDLEAIVDAVDLSQIALIGWGTSGIPAMEFAIRHPDSVTRLILYGTWSRITDVMPIEQVRSFGTMARTDWKMTSQMLTDVEQRTEDVDLALGLAEHYRWTMSGEWFADMVEGVDDHEVDLGAIKVPTVVLHRRDSLTIPFSSAQRIASGIPNARLIPLPKGNNLPSLGNFTEVTDPIITALDADAIQAASTTADQRPSPFRAVVFTDLVGHTEMMARLGDDAGREVLRDHERITRDVLADHGGTEVKTMGDGFMASFASVTKSVECAIALQKAFANREGEPLSIRVGINAGEPIEEEGDLFGATVILASRIAAKADGGEIVVANAVREICTGKGFLFADRGEFVAKGFEEPVRVYEVNWRT